MHGKQLSCARLADLEPNHTHFTLTSGDRWGAETEVLFALVAALSEGVPLLALLANGGTVAREEVRRNVRQGREIVVIRGSGRLADAIAAAVRGEARPDDDLAAVVHEGCITRTLPEARSLREGPIMGSRRLP